MLTMRSGGEGYGHGGYHTVPYSYNTMHLDTRATLNNGHSVPAHLTINKWPMQRTNEPILVTPLPSNLLAAVLALGTAGMKKEHARQVVSSAIRMGYCHIDCAMVDRNLSWVGLGIQEAVQEGVITRNRLFITCKLWMTHCAPDNVKPAVERSMTELGVGYLDLLLIQWPVAWAKDKTQPNPWWPRDKSGNYAVDTSVSILDTWGAMEKLVDEGLVRSIGVSNFSKEELYPIVAENCRIRPTVNQVECHPYLPQKELVQFMDSKGIKLFAHTPLGGTSNSQTAAGVIHELCGISPVHPLLLNPVVTHISAKTGRTPGQVILRWAIQKGFIVGIRSSHPLEVAENSRISCFELQRIDVEHIDELGIRNLRAHNPPYRANGGAIFPGYPVTTW